MSSDTHQPTTTNTTMLSETNTTNSDPFAPTVSGAPNRHRPTAASRSTGVSEPHFGSYTDLLPIASTIGKYRILHNLGTGSFSFVKLALDMTSVHSSPIYPTSQPLELQTLSLDHAIEPHESLNTVKANGSSNNASPTSHVSKSSSVANHTLPTDTTIAHQHHCSEYHSGEGEAGSLSETRCPASCTPRKVALKCVDKQDQVKATLLKQEAKVLFHIHRLPIHDTNIPDINIEATELDDSVDAGETLSAEERKWLQRGQEYVVHSGELLSNDKVLCLVLEYCSGMELFDYLMDHHLILTTGATGISESHAKPIFRSLLEAVFFLHHRGVAHCDLKLENILVSDTDPPSIKLIDFGLSQIYNPNEKAGFPRGSEPYVPPELVLRQPIHPLKADVWALGVILFAMLTLRMPFDAEQKAVKALDLGLCESPVGTPEVSHSPGGQTPSSSTPPLPIPLYPSASRSSSLEASSASTPTSASITPLALLTPSGEEFSLRSKPSLSNGNPVTRRMFHRIAVGAYKFTSEETLHLSADVQDLVSKLLTREPSRRPAVKDLLSHPWFAGMCFETNLSSQPRKENLKNVTAELSNLEDPVSFVPTVSLTAPESSL
ncbi:hypothetical protein O5D80_006721 [Batrachochytrium dendrobatidis]|nr:hypothetical protein O5D80_006721 [Batrachochytrium dendrobatidis]